MHVALTSQAEMLMNTNGRLSIAIGISAALHIVAFIMLASVIRFSLPTYPLGQGGNLVLQTLLKVADNSVQVAESEPEPIRVMEERIQPRAPVATPAPAPAAAEQAPTEAGKADAPPQETPVMSSGVPDPPVMITTRALQDLGSLPSSNAELLAQRFTAHVQRRPELRVPLLVLYPRQALDERRDARITAALAITENGAIAEHTIVPDDPLFGPAIVEALKDARFNPAEIDGRAVAYWAIIEFVFTVGQQNRR